jgi:hypothetical protein
MSYLSQLINSTIKSVPDFLKSPPFYHSTLTFDVPIDEGIIDERGNRSVQTTKVKIIAQLRRREAMPKLYEVDSQGRAEGETIYEGTCINPKKVPSALVVGIVGEGVINGKEGKIQLLPSAESTVKEFAEIAGDRIRIDFIEFTSFGTISE